MQMLDMNETECISNFKQWDLREYEEYSVDPTRVSKADFMLPNSFVISKGPHEFISSYAVCLWGRHFGGPLCGITRTEVLMHQRLLNTLTVLAV
jgi:hypothetical protein